MRALLIASLCLLAACGGYQPIYFQPVPVPDALTRVASSPNFHKLDGTSFANAEMLYPARIITTSHHIPVGDYLFSRVVLGLPENPSIEQIKLENYSSRCQLRGTFGPHLWCTTTAAFTSTLNGTARHSTVSEEIDVGSHYIAGDYAPPFTTGENQEGPIYAQARIVTSSIAQKMVREVSTIK